MKDVQHVQARVSPAYITPHHHTFATMEAAAIERACISPRIITCTGGPSLSGNPECKQGNVCCNMHTHHSQCTHPSTTKPIHKPPHVPPAGRYTPSTSTRVDLGNPPPSCLRHCSIATCAAATGPTLSIYDGHTAYLRGYVHCMWFMGI